MELPVKATRATKMLGFDADGDPVMSTSTVDDIDGAVDIISSSTVSFTNVVNIAALRLIGSAVSDNDSISVLGYYAEGDNGGGEFFWDATSTATDNGGTIIKATGVATGRWLRVYTGAINVQWFGTVGDGTTDDNAAIQAAIDTAGIYGHLIIPKDDYFITGLTVDGSYSRFYMECYGRLNYGTGTGNALTIAPTGTGRMWGGTFKGINIYKTYAAPFEALSGVAVSIENCGQCNFDDFWVKGFQRGYSLHPNEVGGAVTICVFNNCSSQDCHWNIYMDTGAFTGCFVTANQFFGGYQVTNQVNYTDNVTSDAALVNMLNANGGLSGNTVDGNTFTGMTLEQPVHRKVYCEGNSNSFVSCYFDTGSLHSGNTHASGTYPYRQAGLTGFTSAGSKIITKTAHGLATYISLGDELNVGSAVDMNDNGGYVVDGIDANTITLNRAMAGTGTVVLQHFTTNIQFGSTGGDNNAIIECGTAGLQTITSGSTLQNNRIIGGHLGMFKGALPGLSAASSATVPAGVDDTPTESLFNLGADTPSPGQDIIAYLGNLNDEAAGVNVRLSFYGLDASQRPSPYAAVEAIKEGRNTSTAYGGLALKVKPSTVNGNLVDAIVIGSDKECAFKGPILQGDITSGISAAGTVIGDATQLTTDINYVNTVAAGSGVKLPAATAGKQITVIGWGANSLKCYPAVVGDRIITVAAGAAVTIASTETKVFTCFLAGYWSIH
jgi:hypothetical protein